MKSVRTNRCICVLHTLYVKHIDAGLYPLKSKHWFVICRSHYSHTRTIKLKIKIPPLKKNKSIHSKSNETFHDLLSTTIYFFKSVPASSLNKTPSIATQILMRLVPVWYCVFLSLLICASVGTESRKNLISCLGLWVIHISKTNLS